MKKMGKTAAGKFEKAINNQFNEVEKIVCKLGTEEFEVDVYTNIAAVDLNKLIEVAIISGYIDGKIDTFYRDCTIAKFIVEYFTSIQVPVVKTPDGDIEDIYTCYDIVFGCGELINKSEKLKAVIERVISYSEFVINNKIANDTYVNKFCAKFLEIYDILQSEIRDIADNPAAVDNMLKLLDGYLDKEKSDK